MPAASAAVAMLWRECLHRALAGLFLATALVTSPSESAVSPTAIEPGVSQTLARERAMRVTQVRYRLDLAIDPSVQRLSGQVEIRFDLSGAARTDLLLDWRPATAGGFAGRLRQLRVNGSLLGDPRVVSEHVVLPGYALRAGGNVVEVRIEVPVATSGTAATRYHDGADGADYVYTLLVPSDASTLFPCFDQPDLKARFTLQLATPAGWTVVSNAPQLESAIDDGTRRTLFAATEPISTYLFAFAAGPFAALQDDASGDPTRLLVRQSQLERARAEAPEVLRLNREAVRWYADWFGHAFPFAKYDLVLIPEFPYGGMEHAGATFLREDAVLFASQPGNHDLMRRAQLIFHETAHQWFGNLVTMRWFDDLWLKEGFANYMAARAAQHLTPQWDAWPAFHATKTAAYRTDVTQGTTPVWQPLANLSAAKSAYGNIVYSKAPALLRQAEFYLGEEVFRKAVRALVASHAYGNAEWRDLVRAFEQAAGRSLDAWARVWVERRGVPVVTLDWREDRDARVTGFRVQQRDSLNEGGVWPMRLRVHVLRADGAVQRETVLLEGAQARVEALDTSPAPLFAYANHGDFGYGIFLPDARSRNWLQWNLRQVPDEFLRALLWEALWEAVRHADLAPGAYIDLALRDIAIERSEVTVIAVLGRVQAAYLRYLNDAQRAELEPRVERWLERGMQDSPATGLRIAFLRSFIALAGSESGRVSLKRLLTGELPVPGVTLSTRDRFAIVQSLIAAGDPDGEALLASHAALNSSDDGRRYAYIAGAAKPDAARKHALYRAFTTDASLAERWIEDSLPAFNDARQSALTLPLLESALAELPKLKRNRRIFFVNNWLAAFIGGQHDARALKLVRDFLRRPGLDADLRRKVLEAVDGLERTVRIRRQ